MPLTRYQARNEYGLADPDLYQAADKDDPEALLEGVAMAGLVGILRQLGDLAEFAAEMFHDLHEEVMATASRSHGLMARVQQLEAEFPFVEKALLCQTDHSPFFSNKGVEWHPNLQLEQSVVTRGDLPRCVMDSYEECRGPPRLFLLDKFDISGAGACLKRYTDPSFVRHETSSYEASWDDIQREKKSQKAKRRASQWRNGGTPENALTSHAKLHELFLEEHLEARHHSDPARIVKLKTRKLDGYSLISKSGESYMGKFVQTSVDNKTGYELSTWNMDSARDVVTDVPKIISMVDAPEKSHGGSRAEVSLPNEQENAGLIEKDIETVPESTHSEFHGTTITKDAQTNLNGKPGFLQHRSYSEDLASEADNYVDAPATMESETETDDECSRPKDRSGASKDGNHHHTYSDAGEEKMQDPPEFSFLHSVGNTPVSENGQSSFGKGSTSFSYSDTASVSVDDQSDGEKFSGRLPSTCSIKSELVDSTSRATPEANIVSRDFNVQESVSSSNADGGASFSSNDTCSNPRPVSQNAESCSLTVQSLSPEIVDTSPELVRLDLTKGGSDGSEVDPVDSSKSGASSDVKISNVLSETSSISSISEGSKYDTPIDKNCMVDSQTSKLLPVVDNDVETNSTVACSKVLANSDSDTKRCDASSLTGKLVPCSTEMEMEASPDMPSKVCGPGTVDETHLEDTFDAETDCAAVPNAVADVDSQSLVAGVDSQNSVVDDDSQSSVAEIYNEHSCAFGATADVSVSESREDTLENGMSMPSEIDSKLTSDFNSGGEKLVGGASPTYNKCDEEISDIPAEFRSSDMHDEGFHDLPGLDNAATDIVPNVELAVSDNHADSSCDDVSLPSTSLTSSLPWISKNTFQSSSEAGDICPDIPAEFHSSDIHGEGFHDLPGLDNAATDNVSNVERAVSDNHADSSCDDVNDAVSLPSTSLTNSLPWISKNTAQSSSEAGEICHDTVVESDGTLPAESNPESEKIMQKIPLEVSSEGLGTALDHNDLASCGSSSPMASLDQSDRDAETKSPCKSILDDNCVDFSPVNNLNLFESVTIEELAKVQTPCASHSFTDEELKQSSVFKGLELNSPKQELNLEPSFRSFGLIPETTAPNQEDMPPLPPLPPMQWRIGKAPHSFAPTFMGESGETSSSAMSSAPPFDSSLNTQIGSKPSELAVSLGSDKSEQVPEDILNNTSENPLQSSSQFPTFGTDLNIQFGNFGSQRTQTADLPAEEPTMPNHGGIEDFGSEESNNLLADHAAQNHELVYAQDSSLQLPQDPSSKYEDFKNDTDVHVSQSSEGDYSCPETKASTRTQSTKVEDNGDSVPDTSNAETAGPSNSSVQRMVPASLGDAMWPVSAFTVAPTLDTDKPEKVPVVRLPRPRSPLVDAVAAHDRRTMKKVSERFQPPIKSKQDDKDSLLAQIRNKSVSLKPAVATRPSIQTGPKTNLRVAAILEKANTIRQAMAGSDEDEDSDSWSDS